MIKILSNSTINKISAGEVIERPSSVVKELVENAIDAGATKISITLECSGKNLIVIKDNGFGMTKDDLELAVLRHATSKLDEDDLLNINSFGFRGEALPSIGAISKFKITSKKRENSSSYSLSIIGGTIEPTILANINEGTIIEVRDLFFATPARLKFLRSDKTELASIVLVVKKIALAHPAISFTLSHDGREIINVKSREHPNTIKDRIEEILGKEFTENATEVSLFRDDVEIYGYSSIPTYNRAASDDQFLFINNRPVKDKILNIALKVSYQDYLARDRHPVSVLFIKLNPHFVDVNVHPAKSEVRFHDPNLIRSLVISAVKDALARSSNQVSNIASSAALNYMRPTSLSSQSFNEKSANNQGKFQLPTSHTQNLPISARLDYAVSNTNLLIKTTPQSNVEAPSLEKDTDFPLGAAKTQLHGTYIISQTPDSIIIIDQHAAHERIGYEKIKEQIEKNGLIKQRLLIPSIIELPDTQRAELLNEHKLLLADLGLTIEKFGENSIIVSEIPSLVGDININQLVHDLADHLQSMGEHIALSELIEHITETYACHYAIRAGRVLNAEEMNGLLRLMENTPFSGQCNHGRQTYVELKLKDIEKLFGRK
ncbi:DNA mismatch repair protein MutL [Candidatus Megaera venefica]|uniref:DNA mismatch repair protein MutL n=1 Tax=Candidatus Megaera venefica TaxID=2055910 RepID=A0ABU5NBX0_9RICK|nr:DNA mismatch repair protein MutL [Candidatus Megaera venefica]